MPKIFDVLTNRLIELSQQFQNQGSGWQFRKVESLDINIDPFEPLSGSSYIPLPKKIADKNAIINVKNLNDNECFKWAVTSAIYTAKDNPGRLNKKMRINSEKFNWNGIEFPVSLKQIVKFEKQNPFAVNVFGIEGEKVYPLRISEEREKQFIDLLLILKGETKHYCLVKNKSRLLSSQVSKHKSSRFFCDRCINRFSNKPALEKHLEYCSNNKTARIEFPKPKDKDGEELDCPVFLKFKNFNRSMRVPFVIYADFECFTEKIKTYYPDESRSFTNQYQHHKPSGFCYLIKCFDDELMNPKLVQYTAESSDEDISKKFIDSIEYQIKNIYSKFKFKKKIQMTPEDEIAFQNAEICHICDKKLDNDKVRDHCHLTGKYRGVAYDYCNENYQIPKFFPVIFHNLTGYDSHLFIKNLGVSEGFINCIPNNEEKYISFTKDIEVVTFMEKDKKKTGEMKEKIVKREIRFVDSFKFMASSLDKLTANLDEASFQCVKKFFHGEQFDLVRRKGVYPYDYVNSLTKLSETKLPPQEEFYSELNHSSISDEDYEHAKKSLEILSYENNERLSQLISQD